MSRGKHVSSKVIAGRAGHDQTPELLATPPPARLRPRFYSGAGLRQPNGCWHRTRFERKLLRPQRQKADTAALRARLASHDPGTQRKLLQKALGR